MKKRLTKKVEPNKIYNMDCLNGLKKLPDASINCCVTSPPYWALRDYGVIEQLGLETTFCEYINNLCNIFDEVKRVLKDDGTCWVNIGDTYNSSTKSGNDYYARISNSSWTKQKTGKGQREFKQKNYPEKCLVQIPFRFSIEMCNRGWILRNVIIWHKPNCMPSSVKDRFTVDFEYLFFFVKNKKYWFEIQYEPISSAVSPRRTVKGKSSGKELGSAYGRVCGTKAIGRNKRTVWKICTRPFKGEHFATYPEGLIETPIKAGCPQGGIVLDPFMGSGTTAVVAKKHNRNFIGFELNPEYIQIAKERIQKERAGKS